MKLASAGIILLFFGISFSGCAGSKCQADLIGVWGGEHIGMVVSDSSATLDYDCAYGTIDEPFITDDNGEFEVTGVHVIEHGGAIRIDETPDEHPALYQGKIKDNVMTLKVTLTDTGEEIGTFTLIQGAIPNVHKCL
ncbi:MAG: hypothetical protein DRI23_04665 [Candidatus Cloacimonadota bacterium]|nr:MAG: hypothetical protein DRI23_04665 [Candidatus Cloacimonadota bacterium]